MDFNQEKLKRMLISLSRVLNLVRSNQNNRTIAIALYSFAFLSLQCSVSLHMYASIQKLLPARFYSRYLVKCC